MLQIMKRMLREVKVLVKFILQGIESQTSEPGLLIPPLFSALLKASEGLPSTRNCQVR